MFFELIFVVVVSAYFYLKRHFSYWKRKGVHQIEPNYLFGNFKELFKGKASLAKLSQQFYEEFKFKGVNYGGIYEILTPSFVPVEKEIIKYILQTDVNHFLNHGVYVNEKVDPLSGHLFALEDDKWRTVRASLSQIFTKGKLKMMFPIMLSCGQELRNILKEYAKLKDGIDIKDIVARFTTDIIGSVVFGLDCNSLKNPDSEFRQYGKKIFENPISRKIKRLVTTNFPKWLVALLKIKMNTQDIEDFFMNVVKSTIEYRERNNVYRKDFFHMLLQLKNKGKVTDDEDFKPKFDKEGQFSFNDVVANCVSFFMAGFEPTSTTITTTIWELAINQEIQVKLRHEILTVLEKYDNSITYDTLMDMKYLDKVVNETLRKYPPTPFIGRVCTTPYRIPNTQVVIEKGNRVLISVLGVHMDPDNYPEPEKYDPERFSDDNGRKRHSHAYFPFGTGPRFCIANRFALLQIKLGVAIIIRDFQITLNEKRNLPVVDVSKAVDEAKWLKVQYLK